MTPKFLLWRLRALEEDGQIVMAHMRTSKGDRNKNHWTALKKTFTPLEIVVKRIARPLDEVRGEMHQSSVMAKQLGVVRDAFLFAFFGNQVIERKL